MHPTQVPHRLTAIITCLLALAFAAPAALAQEDDTDQPDQRRITGKFRLSTHALIVHAQRDETTNDEDGDDAPAVGNVRVVGRGVAVAKPRVVVMRLTTLTNEGETVEVTIRIGDPLKRSKRVHGKLFRGDAVAKIVAGDRTAHVKVVIAGSIAPDGDGGAKLSARIHTLRSDAPVRLRGHIKGVKVSNSTDDPGDGGDDADES